MAVGALRFRPGPGRYPGTARAERDPKLARRTRTRSAMLGCMTPSSDAVRLHTRLLERTLPKQEWTHEAHLIACWVDLALHDGDVDATVDSLRNLIRSYNEATGCLLYTSPSPRDKF